MYKEEYGSLKLTTSINKILTHSMHINIMLKLFKNMHFSKEDIDDEMRIISWEHEIQSGQKKNINKILTNMFEEEQISKIIQLAYKSNSESQVHLLILEFLIKKLTNDDSTLYGELCVVKKKILYKLLYNKKFQVSFIDATFFIGRSMIKDDEELWITELGFSYSDLKSIIDTLLDGPEDLYTLIVDRMKLAKELDEIWNFIIHDCII